MCKYLYVFTGDINNTKSCLQCNRGFPQDGYFILTGSLIGVFLLVLLSLLIFIVACITVRHRIQETGNEREMPIYDVIEPNYESVKPCEVENTVKLTVNDAYNF